MREHPTRLAEVLQVNQEHVVGGATILIRGVPPLVGKVGGGVGFGTGERGWYEGGIADGAERDGTLRDDE